MVKLSQREQEALVHFLRSGRLKQVAANMQITQNRAWVLKREAMRKLGVENNVELVRVATKIFLPNPGADLSVYGSTFKLTEREQQLLEEMRTGEMLVKTPKESRRLRLQLSKTRLEEYGNQFLADESAELEEAFS